MYDVLFDVLILTLFNILDLIFLSDVNYFCNMTILFTLDVYEINVSQWKKAYCRSHPKGKIAFIMPFIFCMKGFHAQEYL